MSEWAIIEADWQHVRNMCPKTLEESAREMGAVRRARQIRSAGDLLRLALAYSVCDMSLRQVAAWAQMIGLGSMSNVAVLKRLRNAAAWLGHVVLCWLAERGRIGPLPAVSVRIVDATTICEPGSKGTDWRLHLSMDLETLRISQIELTGPEGGESLARYCVDAGQILLADRGYAHREAVAGVIEAGGSVVVRLNWQNFPLERLDGQHIEMLDLVEGLEPGQVGDWPVQFRAHDRVYGARLVATAKTEAAAEQDRRRIRRQAQHKGRTPDPRSLRAAGYTFVLTNVPETLLGAEQVLELYRLRWQIELCFKRLKSILHLDHLRAKDRRLAMAYLYAKLLSALIIEALAEEAAAFSPWGYRLRARPAQPVAGLPDSC